jgi:hypothetical protein
LLTNTFTNVKNPVVQTLTDIPTILNQIQNNPYKSEIERGRVYGKGHPVYEQIKTSLPTFTPNGCFTKTRKTQSLCRLSGFIYLDIDYPEVPPKTFQSLPWVYSYWKSFGGVGYNLLVSVSGLTIDNFKDYWSSLEGFFNQIDIIIDPHCQDISRQSVISYDPDIYINPNFIPYTTSSGSCNSTNTFTPTNTSDTLNTEYNPTEYIKIKYQTTLETYDDKDCIVIPDGKDYRNTYLPRIILEGERHKWICNYTSSILFNNPTITKNQLRNNVYKVNRYHCIPPLSEEEMNSLVSWSFGKHKNNQLKIKTKKKKIWINPEKKLTRNEKRSIIGKETGKLRKVKTTHFLIEVYRQLLIQYPRVTQKLLQHHSNRSLRTIKKYWNEIKEGVLC